MSIATSQQITKYYETFRSIDVTFTKEVVKSVGLVAQNVYLKCLGEQWPCVVYSGSFDGARILAPTKQNLMDRIAKANNMVSLRLSFQPVDKPEPINFFVGGRIVSLAPYDQSNGTLQFITIQYVQRPAEVYIETMGRMLEANVNSSRRRDDRIILTPTTIRKIHLVRKETTVLIQGVPRKCIVRDLSFFGAKIIIVGLAKFLVGKQCQLQLEFDEPEEIIDVPGVFVRFEDVEGRKDLAAVAIDYNAATIPISYKMHLNDFLGQQRKGQHADDGFQPGHG
jgi:hypothetical protein